MIVSILVASIIAYPLTYLLNQMILQNFAERIKLGTTELFSSFLILLVFVAGFVGLFIYHLARKNPVEALKYE